MVRGVMVLEEVGGNCQREERGGRREEGGGRREEGGGRREEGRESCFLTFLKCSVEPAEPRSPCTGLLVTTLFDAATPKSLKKRSKKFEKNH
jgi:hypothetical protein